METKSDMIRWVHSELTRMLAGDLFTPVAEQNGAVREVAALLEKVRQTWLRLEEELEATSAQTTSVAEETHRIVAQVRTVLEGYAGIERTTALLDNVATRLFTTIQEERRELERVDGIALSLNEFSRQMEEMAQNMRNYLETIEHTFEEINRVFQYISDVADRTRIVAINASIEAARAGVHGQAFSAVARAIKDLAEQSAQVVASTAQVVVAFRRDVYQTFLSATQAQEAASSGVREACLEIKEGLGEQKNHTENILESTRVMQQEIRQRLSEIGTYFKQWEQAVLDLQEVMTLLEKMREAVASSLHIKTVRKESLLTYRYGKKLELLIEKLQQLAGSQEIQSFVPESHRGTLERFLQEHPFLEAIYTTRDDGTFICSIPPAGLVNARMRPWWQEGMKGQVYISPLYVSAITRRFCVTVSLPVVGSLGKPLGVLGVDVGVNGAGDGDESARRAACTA